MVSRLLLGALLGTCLTRAGAHVTFPVPNDVLQVYVSASIEQVSAAERYLHIEVIKDKSSCCHGVIKFVALVEHDGTVSEVPVEISDHNVSGENKVSAGSVEVKHFRLKVTHLELSKEVPAKLYDGIVAKDDGCMSDAIEAMNQAGSASRKALSELIDDGCIQVTPYVMTAGDESGGLSKVHLVRGKRVGYTYLFPASWAESPETILNGWIFAGLLEAGHKQVSYVLPESPVSELILVEQHH